MLGKPSVPTVTHCLGRTGWLTALPQPLLQASFRGGLFQGLENSDCDQNLLRQGSLACCSPWSHKESNRT